MDTTDQLQIPVSREKSIILITLSLAFVVTGIIFILDPELISAGRRNPSFIIFMGYTSVLFFGLGVIVGIKTLFQSSPGLILDSRGITYDPQKPLERFIEWNKITGFSEIKIRSQRIVMIYVDNPEELIKQEKDIIRKKTMRLNMNLYGAPLCLSSNILKINFDELFRVLNNYSRRHTTSSLGRLQD